MEIKNFPIIQEEKSTKIPVDLWRVHKPTKKSVWLTNQRKPCCLKHKPNPKTSWYLNKRIDQNRHKDPRLPERQCRDELRTDL